VAARCSLAHLQSAILFSISLYALNAYLKDRLPDPLHKGGEADMRPLSLRQVKYQKRTVYPDGNPVHPYYLNELPESGSALIFKAGSGFALSQCGSETLHFSVLNQVPIWGSTSTGTVPSLSM
jgi:hypothetical protein